jgi:hypothetical protein
LEQQVKRRIIAWVVTVTIFSRKHGFKIVVLEMILHPPLKGKYKGLEKTSWPALIQWTIIESVRKPSHSAEAQVFYVHAAPVATDNLL